METSANKSPQVRQVNIALSKQNSCITVMKGPDDVSDGFQKPTCKRVKTDYSFENSDSPIKQQFSDNKRSNKPISVSSNQGRGFGVPGPSSNKGNWKISDIRIDKSGKFTQKQRFNPLQKLQEKKLLDDDSMDSIEFSMSYGPTQVIEEQ